MCRSGCAVYPRSRGEHYDEASHDNAEHGLSPLARGTRSCPRSGSTPCRFIPARAGNTPFMAHKILTRSVYPRSRGEHHSALRTQVLTIGLSPLARGTLLVVTVALIDNRFIPARAGNTSAGSPPKRKVTVYPRSRGEHLERISMGFGRDGLSPLARGTRTANVSTS